LCSAITLSEIRTSGRTSAAIEPSLRATRIASYSPASDAITCVIRGSRARASRSNRSSSATFASSVSAVTGSLAEYSDLAPPMRSSAATADWPCRPMARVAIAACVNASRLMSSE